MPDDRPATTMDDRARLARFVSADESRPRLMAPFRMGIDGRLWVVASDGHRLLALDDAEWARTLPEGPAFSAVGEATGAVDVAGLLAFLGEPCKACADRGEVPCEGCADGEPVYRECDHCGGDKVVPCACADFDTPANNVLIDGTHFRLGLMRRSVHDAGITPETPVLLLQRPTSTTDGAGIPLVIEWGRYRLYVMPARAVEPAPESWRTFTLVAG